MTNGNEIEKNKGEEKNAAEKHTKIQSAKKEENANRQPILWKSS